jgi:hypothetical protein
VVQTFTGYDASGGEEIAQTFSLISLCVDEKNLALEMAGVCQCSGKGLILPGVVFEAEGFSLECAIEAWADLVGFVIGIQDGSVFSALGGCGKVSYSFADNTDKRRTRPDSM